MMIVSFGTIAFVVTIGCIVLPGSGRDVDSDLLSNHDLGASTSLTPLG